MTSVPVKHYKSQLFQALQQLAAAWLLDLRDKAYTHKVKK